jgi:multiple sugar transport system permease protein
MKNTLVQYAYKPKSKISIGRILVYVFLTIGALIMIVPFLWMLSTSLKDQQQLFAWPPNWFPHPFVWSNYSEVMTKIKLAA